MLLDVIIDMQGFKQANNKFVVKELAIVPVDSALLPGGLQQRTVVFDEPFPFDELPLELQKANTWLTKEYHGLPWDAMGDVCYEDIGDTLKELLEGVTKIFVKGKEKKQWLRELIGKPTPIIADLEDWGCPSIRLKQECCWQHRRLTEKPVAKFHCALRNVEYLKTWYNNYVAGSFEKSLKIFCEREKDLSRMFKEDIEYLPKFFILEFAKDQIDEAFDYLPWKLKQDPEIKEYRRCMKHWNSSSPGDEFDGPVPLVKDCALCQLYKQ